MHKRMQLNQAALFSAYVAGSLALVSSGDHGHAAAPEAPGYAVQEFKVAAVKQVAQCGYPASKVAACFGVSIYSLYLWTKRYAMPEEARQAVDVPSRRNAAPEGRVEARHGGG